MRFQLFAAVVLLTVGACSTTDESAPADASPSTTTTAEASSTTSSAASSAGSPADRPTPDTTTTSTTTPPVRREPEGPIRVSSIGDGVAFGLNEGLIPALRWVGAEARGAAVPGCGIAAGLPVDENGDPFAQSRICRRGTRNLHDEIRDEFDPDLITWLSTWEMHDRFENDEHLRLGTPEHDRALSADLARTAERFTRHGAEVVVLTVVPPPVGSAAAAESSDERFEHYNELLREMAADNELVRILELGDILCPDGPPCPSELDGLTPRPDGLHISTEGARWLAPQLLVPILANI